MLGTQASSQSPRQLQDTQHRRWLSQKSQASRRLERLARAASPARAIQNLKSSRAAKSFSPVYTMINESFLRSR